MSTIDLEGIPEPGMAVLRDLVVHLRENADSLRQLTPIQVSELCGEVVRAFAHMLGDMLEARAATPRGGAGIVSRKTRPAWLKVVKRTCSGRPGG